MSQINPYQPPTADQFPPIQAKLVGAPDGLWQHGRVLVVRIGAVFPPVCLKSNEPTTSRWRRTFSWHPPWVAITILIGLLIYVILALVMTKRATLELPISDYWLGRRRWGLLIGWLIALAGIGIVIGAISLADPNANGDWSLFAVLFGLIGMPIIGLIVGSIAGRLVWSTKIDDSFVYLKGVSPDYLAKLPPWPGR